MTDKNDENIDLIVKDLKTQLASSLPKQEFSTIYKDKSNETNVISQEDNLCELGYN